MKCELLRQNSDIHIQVCVTREYVTIRSCDHHLPLLCSIIYYNVLTCLKTNVLKTIQKLSRLEGVVFDPVYTGKAFHGLLTEIDNGRFQDERDLVFVHTGGLFGLFPYASQLATIT